MRLFGKSSPANTKAGSPSRLRAEVGAAVAARLDADPAVERAASMAAQVYTCADFLDAARCRALIAAIDADRRPSTLFASGSEANFRTSESCDLNRWSPDVQPIDEAIATLLGIDPAHGETMQGQRYAAGQHFRAHCDYFHQAGSYWNTVKGDGGQRTWTAMIYLDDVAAGGATWFPQAGLRIAPRRGLLLAWNNMNPDGSPNENTLHEGMAVTEGVKYVVTKWFREAKWLK